MSSLYILFFKMVTKKIQKMFPIFITSGNTKLYWKKKYNAFFFVNVNAMNNS